MPLDLAALTATPDLRAVAPLHARLVCALRYLHVARRAGSYEHTALARQLGSDAAVMAFHVLVDEAGRAWPDPIALNPPCQPALSYDEMVLADLFTAAARGDRAVFDDLLREMVCLSGRRAIWSAARRLARSVAMNYPDG